jgi:hypothetical protein
VSRAKSNYYVAVRYLVLGVAAINVAGLRIEGPGERFTAQPTAIGPGDLPDRIDSPGKGFVASLQAGLPSGSTRWPRISRTRRRRRR